MTGPVLALNAGSSSLKFALFEDATALVRGQVSGIGTHLEAEATAEGKPLDPPVLRGTTQEEFLPGLLDWLCRHGRGSVAVAGHRVVHGGTRFTAPVRVDDGVLAALDGLVPLAPLHQPHSLAAIRAAMAALPGVPQVACFDTAFHATMPDVATWLGLPRALHDEGVRRYGFHGLSYEFIAGRLRELAPELAAGRVIVAHLGNGASLCALRDGRSVGTTMGLTALDGLLMATRPGSLDPGAVLHLLQARGMSAAEVEDVLYHRAGLLGVSGISGDMRDLAGSADPRAREAVALFVHRILGCAGSLAAQMGGLDGIVFTAGIGEHDAAVRAGVCAGLEWLGLVLDGPANRGGRHGPHQRRRQPGAGLGGPDGRGGGHRPPCHCGDRWRLDRGWMRGPVPGCGHASVSACQGQYERPSQPGAGGVGRGRPDRRFAVRASAAPPAAWRLGVVRVRQRVAVVRGDGTDEGGRAKRHDGDRGQQVAAWRRHARRGGAARLSRKCSGQRYRDLRVTRLHGAEGFGAVGHRCRPRRGSRLVQGCVCAMPGRFGDPGDFSARQRWGMVELCQTAAIKDLLI